ncbi:MAG: lytic murein transglycosylase [bacterium]|nr:lytic murein transglycosylase [bacterium]
MRFIAVLLFIPTFILNTGYSILNTIPVAFAQSASEREALERQLIELENQIAQHEATVNVYKKQGKTLQGEVSSLNSKIAKLNLQIKAITLNLSKLDKDITVNKGQITEAEDKLETNKGALANLIRRLNEEENLGLMEVVLRNPRLSDFFGNLNSILVVKDTLSITVGKVAKLREDLLDKKEALANKRSDAAALKAYQDSQKASIAKTKKDKDALLKETKGQESKYQEILKETRKTAAQIRSRIFEFLGGGEMSFDEAYQFAKFAEQATGVRAAFILAILDRESALGQNVGKCGYKTAMHPTRDTPLFLALTASLSINPDTITVSCANSDGAYGGAMGPSQFIPSTWNIYKDRIAEVTGHNPASPWNNGDAFVGTALYMKDSLTGCRAIYSKQLDQERCAAAKYYAGGRWRSHLWGYGDRVVTKAQQFQSDIDILNS